MIYDGNHLLPTERKTAMETILTAADITAKINPQGAQLTSLKKDGTEYLWQADAAYWGSSAPVLFPAIGALKDQKTLIGGKSYEMHKHGFARDELFQVVEQTASRAVFSLRDNSRTRRQYPYSFDFRVAFSLEDGSLTTRYSCRNLGDEEMFFMAGGHPAFNCPPENDGGKSLAERFEDCSLIFEYPETADMPRILPGGIVDLNDRLPVLQNQRELPLHRGLFYNDTILFTGLQSRWVKMVDRQTGRGVKVAFDGMDYLAIWTPNQVDAPFLCIEPWMGLPDCTDSDGEYCHKRGVRRLLPGEEYAVSFVTTPFA